LIVVVAGTSAGYFTVKPVVNLIPLWSNVKNGPWSTNFSMGSTGANPYVRAWVAENGLMALNKSEVIYLDAYSDDDANPLVSSCDYIIQGRAPDARWWDITVYDQDGFLIANDQDRYSFSSTDITFEPDGSFKIHLSNTYQQGNWLPSGNTKTMSIYLRLHNPGPAYLNARTLQTMELPHIIKESSQQ